MEFSRIILADGDADFVAMMTALSMKEGLYISWLNDGQKVVDTLSSGIIPDLLIIDRNLQCHDAFSLLKSIRSANNLDAMMTVVMSSTPSTEEEIHAFNLGAIDYVHKPVNPKAFTARLAARIRHARRISDFISIPRI